MRELFMIVPPIDYWDKKLEEEIYFDVGLMTIAKTAGEAWRKQTRGDMSKVQFWHDRGYRLKRLKVELIVEPSDKG